MSTWSTPYYGVSHFHPVNKNDLRWLSVNEYSTFTILKMWYAGCGFSPMERQFDTASEARTYGEEWLAGRVFN